MEIYIIFTRPDIDYGYVGFRTKRTHKHVSTTIRIRVWTRPKENVFFTARNRISRSTERDDATTAMAPTRRRRRGGDESTGFSSCARPTNTFSGSIVFSFVHCSLTGRLAVRRGCRKYTQRNFTPTGGVRPFTFYNRVDGKHTRARLRRPVARTRDLLFRVKHAYFTYANENRIFVPARRGNSARTYDTISSSAEIRA